MALPIRWSPRAADHLEQICDYIAQDSKSYAAIFVRRVDQIIKSIPATPKLGRIVPEYDDENLRERLYQGYRIVYRLTPNAVEIVAICHGARLLTGVLDVEV